MKAYLIKILFFSVLAFPVFGTDQALTVNIFSQSNGSGHRILKDALVALGHVVHDNELSEYADFDHEGDINIFFGEFSSALASCAAFNWLIPNSESDLQQLDQVDLILCRTHEEEKLYQATGVKTYHLGFTSHDSKLPAIEMDDYAFLHTAQDSSDIGMGAVVEAWEGDLEMPPLTLVVHDTVYSFQQQNIHCISEKLPLTVVVTWDAPPMNEQIKDKRCLISVGSSLDVEQLKQVVKTLASLSHEELRKIGDQNRSRYLQMTDEFHSNLRRLLEEHAG